MSTINPRPNVRLCLTALCALTMVAMPAVAQDDQMTPEEVMAMLEGARAEDFVPGEVIVKLKEGAEPQAEGRLAGITAGLAADERRTSGGEIIFRVGPGIAGTLSEDDLRTQTLATVESMQDDPSVEYAQLNYIYRIVRTPNDTRYPEQWHYFDNGSGAGQSPGGIGLPPRWDTSTGSSSVVVSVIDTGIVASHPDISGANQVAGFDFISNTFIANDGDGRDADPTDPGDAVAAGECGPGRPARGNSWHGTHVAGTVGIGDTDNGTGVAGVNWQVKVQPIRVLGKCGGTTADINDAIRWAAGLPVPGVATNATPAKVINMSLGGLGACSGSPSQQAAIDDAVAQGVAVVVAAGNDAIDASGASPASCNNVITVAAADARGRLVQRYSNFGATIEIMAPGGDVARDDTGDGNPDGVLSMVQGGYAYYNGTSMASPHVAGVAAMMLAADPSLTPAQILARLQADALPRNATECPSPCGAGLLNADFTTGPTITFQPSSVNLEEGDPAVTLTATVGDGSGAVLPGVVVNFSSANAAVATVAPATTTTDAAGQAKVNVTAVAVGQTQIEATAAGASGSAPVRVNATPTAQLWVLALLAAVAWLLLGRRWTRRVA